MSEAAKVVELVAEYEKLTTAAQAMFRQELLSIASEKGYLHVVSTPMNGKTKRHIGKGVHGYWMQLSPKERKAEVRRRMAKW